MASASIGDPQSMNMFAYVQNNPVDFTDPSGLDGCIYFPDGSVKCEITSLPTPQKRGGANRGSDEQAEDENDEENKENNDCEKQIAAMFANPNAYVADPNDGDTFDKALGFKTVENGKDGFGRGADPHTHIYSSNQGKSKNVVSAYVPKGGKLISLNPRNKIGDSTALIQFEEANVTVALFHLINLKRGSKGQDGRIKIGEIGIGRQGRIGFKSIIKKIDGNYVKVGETEGFGHIHVEVYPGLIDKIP